MRRLIYCGVALLALVLADLARAGLRAQQVRRYPGINEVISYCVALDSNEDIWVTHPYEGYVDLIRANQVTQDGTQLRRKFITYSTFPVGIAIDSNDNVYFASGDSLWKRYPEGTSCGADPNPCLIEVVKTVPHALAATWATVVDDHDNAYVAGTVAGSNPPLHGVWKVSPAEEVSLIAFWPSSAGFHWDLMTDAWGNVFVSEYVGSAGRVFRVTNTAWFPQEIATGVAWIDGLEVDSAGNLWVVGRSVKKIIPDSPSSWSSWTIVDRTPAGFVDASNTWMGDDDTLYTTGVSHGKVWAIQEGESPRLLLDDSTGPPYHGYGLDVVENSKGHLFLSNEAFFGPPASISDVWRICENLDTDLLCDDGDNCTETNNTNNPSQHDPDHDGYGSACDADFDQDGTNGVSDFGTFRECFARPVADGAGPPEDPRCAESDLDGNGTVGLPDYGIFRSLYLRPLGTSGLACAESPPRDGSCGP